MAQDNQTILANAWIEGSNDFQQRIPDPTQAGIAATIDAIFAPMNNRFYNEFVDTLIQRIGYTYVHQQRFRNPLAVFKKEFMYYGATVQETFFKWIKAHSYDDASETLLKLRRPEAEVCYHTVNRQDRYSISVVRQELQQAAAEEFGLNRYIAGIMDVPMNSDEYDEYQIMKELIAFYENTWGFFKVNGSVPTDEASAKTLLKELRAFGGKLRFPSSLYNAAIVQDIPVFVQNPSELVLLVTPEVQASLDVDALAVLFNMEKAEVQSRIVLIDEFPIAGAYALLTTDEFFQCRDTLYENASFYNPETLGVNYFLHHWGVYSVSPFVPAILFTTDPATVPDVIEVQPLTLTIQADADKIIPGGKVKISAFVDGTVDANNQGIKPMPDAANYEVILLDENLDPIIGVQNNRTYVDRLGYLHLQKTGVEPGMNIGVMAKLPYVNPSGATSTISASPIMLEIVADANTNVPVYRVQAKSVACDTGTPVDFVNDYATVSASASGTYATKINFEVTPAGSASYAATIYTLGTTGWASAGTVNSPATTFSLTQGYTTAAPNVAPVTAYIEIVTLVDGNIVGASKSRVFTYGRNYDTNLAKEAPVDFLDPEPGETRE